MKTVSISALLAVILTGCGQKLPLGGASDLRVTAATEMPVPARSDISTSGRIYYIGPFDKLTIEVFGVEELKAREFQVDASGRLSYPLVGTLQVAGSTPDQVTEQLTAALARRGVREPIVTLNISDTTGQLVTVEGEVGEPGLYPVVNKMTLMRAIASAKGTSEFAKLDDVVIFRTVDGQRYAALYNLAAIRRGNYADPEIFANDLVVVGDSPAKRLFKNLLAITPLVTTPLVVALQRGL